MSQPTDEQWKLVTDLMEAKLVDDDEVLFALDVVQRWRDDMNVPLVKFYQLCKGQTRESERKGDRESRTIQRLGVGVVSTQQVLIGESEGGFDEIDAKIDIEVVKGKIPAVAFKVLNARHVLKMSWKEIAREFRIPLNSARWIAEKAKRHLASSMQDAD